VRESETTIAIDRCIAQTVISAETGVVGVAPGAIGQSGGIGVRWKR